MTKVLSLVLAAAQHLDSLCTDCWNRAVRFGKPDLLEVCANSDSPLVEAVESAGEEGLRTSFWNGYDLTTRRGCERLYQFCSTKRPRHVWFSSLWSIITTSVSWRQNSLMSMSEKMMKAVVIGCAWGLRHSQGSLSNRSNHRIRDKKHKHGRLFDISGESSLQFPQSLCQTKVKQLLVKDSWHSVLGILEHVHPDEDERTPIASSHETQWKLIAKLMCHRQLCHHLHCHRHRHLLLMRVQTRLSERRSPIGYKRFINRLDIVTIAPW